VPLVVLSAKVTVLIEPSNTENKTGFFFSTGIIPSLRIEGLVKKLQPRVESITSILESGNSTSLYSQVSRKRIIRFGTAYGLPDYLALKVAEHVVLDNYRIENVEYVLDLEEEIQPSEDVNGHPLYYYDVNVLVKENAKGKVFGSNQPGASTEGVILVVDPEALGLPSGSLLQIQLG